MPSSEQRKLAQEQANKIFERKRLDKFAKSEAAKAEHKRRIKDPSILSRIFKKPKG